MKPADIPLPPLSPIEQILELARWAPSGDNTQPWRFEVLDDLCAVVHGFDTREHCVYDLDGHPSQISLGALLETASIAASGIGMRLDVQRRINMPDSHPTFDLRCAPDVSIEVSDLIPVIKTRSVQRRPFSTRALTDAERRSLESSVGAGHRVAWLEGAPTRLKTAVLMFRSAKLRLVMPEAYQVHRDVIEWDARFSVDKVPDQALGVDHATTRLMRFVMKSWGRVQFFNRFLAGTWLPRIQMDFLPAMGCAAHFVLVSRRDPVSVDDYVDAGRAMQRFWLTAARLGLQLQPEVTPLVFARYSRERVSFSTSPGMAGMADDIGRRLTALVSEDVARGSVFMGRVGAAPVANSRSVRLELAQLAWDDTGAIVGGDALEMPKTSVGILYKQAISATPISE